MRADRQSSFVSASACGGDFRPDAALGPDLIVAARQGDADRGGANGSSAAPTLARLTRTERLRSSPPPTATTSAPRSCSSSGDVDAQRRERTECVPDREQRGCRRPAPARADARSWRRRRRQGQLQRHGLIRAAERGHVAIVRRLFRTDIDVDHVNRPGWTALEAIILGDGGRRHTDVVRMLVSAGATSTSRTERAPRRSRTPAGKATPGSRGSSSGRARE
jgi:uncharacterized protein